MSEPTQGANTPKKPVTLKSKLGLQLEVIGAGEPAGAHKQIETVRVKRKNDGGIRDIARAELEQINGKERVATAIENVAKPTPPPANPPAE